MRHDQRRTWTLGDFSKPPPRGTTAAVATLVYVTTCLFTYYGDRRGADLMPLLAVQRRAVDVFMEREGVGSGTLDKALARANGTVAYMASLPE